MKEMQGSCESIEFRLFETVQTYITESYRFRWQALALNLYRLMHFVCKQPITAPMNMFCRLLVATLFY